MVLRVRVPQVRLRRVARERGAEIRSRGGRAGEAPVGSPPTAALGYRPTGAAAGRRQRLPARPAIDSGPPVGSLTTGPVRGGRHEAILAQRREVDREIDAAQGPLAEIGAPVEHARQGRRGAGRNIRSARELAEFSACGARSCGRPARRRPARRPGPRTMRPRDRRLRRRQPACPSRAPRAARCA